jgi:hypothetical protein
LKTETEWKSFTNKDLRWDGLKSITPFLQISQTFSARLWQGIGTGLCRRLKADRALAHGMIS